MATCETCGLERGQVEHDTVEKCYKAWKEYSYNTATVLMDRLRVSLSVSFRGEWPNVVEFDQRFRSALAEIDRLLVTPENVPSAGASSSIHNDKAIADSTDNSVKLPEGLFQSKDPRSTQRMTTPGVAEKATDVNDEQT